MTNPTREYLEDVQDGYPHMRVAEKNKRKVRKVRLYHLSVLMSTRWPQPLQLRHRFGFLRTAWQEPLHHPLAQT